jgi:AAA+ ATPase superfamily predicted ATPase
VNQWHFVGRKRELAALEQQYLLPESNLVPIYGRRRVGKSELVLHFKGDRPGVYFVGKQAPTSLQIQEFLITAAGALEMPLLARAAIADWKTALSETVRSWTKPGKLILVLDEFQWSVEQDPSLPSVLQELWDREWRRTGKLMLIIAGSYVSFMERELLGSKQPLGGRRTAQIQLQPFKFTESAQFHPAYSREDQARVYFITGGVPLYLLAFKEKLSVAQNICGTFLNEFAPLSREPEFLLREELQGLQKFQAVLDTLAVGRQSLTDIGKALGLDPRSIVYQLDTLVDLGYVEREFPLTKGKPSPKQLRYSMKDALLRFWYRFVFPNLSRIRENPEAAFETLIAPRLDPFYGLCFERLCREALAQLYLKEAPHASTQVGQYWNKDLQIDVVGIRSDNWIDLGECKWGPVTSAPGLASELEAKVQKYPNPVNSTLGRMLFSRRPLKIEKPGLRHFSLADLYGIFS